MNLQQSDADTDEALRALRRINQEKDPVVRSALLQRFAESPALPEAIFAADRAAGDLGLSLRR